MKNKQLVTLLSCLMAAGTADAAVVRQIKVDGLQRVERETVLSYVNVNPGDDVSPEKLNGAFKKLYTTGLFSDVSFDVKGDVLTIKVDENPIINKRFSTAMTKWTTKCSKAKCSSVPVPFIRRPRCRRMCSAFSTSTNGWGVMPRRWSRR